MFVIKIYYFLNIKIFLYKIKLKLKCAIPFSK